MQFFKSTLFVAIAVAASFVAAVPAQSECTPLIGKCTFDSDCCSDECIASEFLWDSEVATILFYLPAFVFLLEYQCNPGASLQKSPGPLISDISLWRLPDGTR
ncbi:hypothetical protein FIBSPDRAFT_891192 [Athelia psychrophila]|uniref:Uncharacterized protein n=1 Tax=Athelia psychrophila TaxID=1759441 RepID=A0A166K3I3_9AGAM|nr:hypothetical protein FIBSPDRAFT_891192 [Fibularhizoctonia sp. CBS 109695]